MRNFSSPGTYRLSITCDEWKLIDIALAAYSHNATFRRVHEKLDDQVASAAASNGIPYTPRAKHDRRR